MANRDRGQADQSRRARRADRTLRGRRRAGREATPAAYTTGSAEEIFHTVANDLRDIAALTVGECANEDAIRRAMKRLEEDAAELPPDLVQSAKAHKLVDEVLADAEDALRSCP